MHKLKQILWNNKCKIISVFIGLFAGWVGILTGLLVGSFIEFILNRKHEDECITQYLNNPFGDNFGKINSSELVNYKINEPFDGSMLLAGIVYFCVNNATVATNNIEIIFKDYCTGDWDLYCRAAARAEALNADLLVECMAVKLRKTNDEILSRLIFKVMVSVEFAWNWERGRKPSDYLAELINYKPQVDDYENACVLLGVPISADMKLIRKAHRQLVALYHPDTTKNLSEEQKKIADEMFIRIQTAYDLISTRKSGS